MGIWAQLTAQTADHLVLFILNPENSNDNTSPWRSASHRKQCTHSVQGLLMPRLPTLQGLLVLHGQFTPCHRWIYRAENHISRSPGITFCCDPPLPSTLCVLVHESAIPANASVQVHELASPAVQKGLPRLKCPPLVLCLGGSTTPTPVLFLGGSATLPQFLFLGGLLLLHLFLCLDGVTMISPPPHVLLLNGLPMGPPAQLSEGSYLRHWLPTHPPEPVHLHSWHPFYPPGRFPVSGLHCTL